MKDYKSMLEHSYAMTREVLECGPESRLEYVATEIFNFTTYDNDMDRVFGEKAIEVCEAITHHKTFEYIKDREKYQWYLIMLNMPFFADRTEWGTSIRGAWWAGTPGKPIELSSCGLWEGGDQIIETLKFKPDEWTAFMQAIIDFASPEMGGPKMLEAA